jgi:tetratricopeptide (TPR) repeat protein
LKAEQVVEELWKIAFSNILDYMTPDEIALAYRDLQVNPRNASTLNSLAVYYAKKGDSGQAFQYSRRARSIDPNDIQFLYDEAEVLALSNRTKEALKVLREAFQKGYPTEEAKNDPELKSLWTLPEFENLVREFSKKANQKE